VTCIVSLYLYLCRCKIWTNKSGNQTGFQAPHPFENNWAVLRAGKRFKNPYKLWDTFRAEPYTHIYLLDTKNNRGAQPAVVPDLHYIYVCFSLYPSKLIWFLASSCFFAYSITIIMDSFPFDFLSVWNVSIFFWIFFAGALCVATTKCHCSKSTSTLQIQNSFMAG